MNWIAIGLAILVVLLFYILYRFFLLKSTEMAASASLNATNPPITINKPGGLRYAYGIWIYVNSWDSNIEKTIFNRDGNIKLYLDSSSPTLKCGITMAGDTANVINVSITDNFPLQKWMYIVVSVDGQYVDTYLDGKLVKSARMYDEIGNIPVISDSDNKMILGSADLWDAHVAKFTHWTEPVDPQTVWSMYMSGNGQSNSIANAVSSYGVDFTVLKDNIAQSNYRLF
jgi:hypothetical protein